MGGVSPAAAEANCHTPLRFCQLGRVSCGRGYSGKALPGPTWLVHGVESGGVLGCQPPSPGVAAAAGTAAAGTAAAGTAATAAKGSAAASAANGQSGRPRRRDNMASVLPFGPDPW